MKLSNKIASGTITGQYHTHRKGPTLIFLGFGLSFIFVFFLFALVRLQNDRRRMQGERVPLNEIGFLGVVVVVVVSWNQWPDCPHRSRFNPN